MSALAVAPRLLDGRGGEPTLDDLIVGAWEGLAAHRVVACPVCDGEMEPVYGDQLPPLGGRCRGCGSKLA